MLGFVSVVCALCWLFLKAWREAVGNVSQTHGEEWQVPYPPLVLCFFFYFLFYIELWLINNVFIVLAIQQSDSVIHVSILFQILFLFRLFQYCAEFLVPYSKSLLVIYFKYSSVYIPIPNTLTIPPHQPFLPVTINFFSKSVNLFCK